MMSIKIKKDLRNLDLLETNVPKNADVSTRRVADDIVRYIKSNWSEDSPSSPGEPPAVVTGKLDRSVEAEHTGRSVEGQFSKLDSMWIVKIGAEYAEALEYGRPSTNLLPRPFVRPAIMWVAETLPDYYKDVISIKLK